MKQVHRLLTVLLAVLSVVLLVLTLTLPHARLPQGASAEHVGFVGTYRLNDDAERLPYSSSVRFSSRQLNQVTLYGHFDRELPPNAQVAMRINNLRVELLVNGQTAFSFGDAHVPIVQSGGNVWTSFTASGISPTDEIELRLSNVYTGVLASCYDEFFDNLSVGSEYVAYRDAFARNAASLLLGILSVTVGLCMLGVCLYLRHTHFGGGGRYLSLSGFLIATGLWIGLNFNYSSLLIPYPAFCQALDILCLALAPVFLLHYLAPALKSAYRRPAEWLSLCALAVATVCVVLQLTGTLDMVNEQGLFSVLLPIEAGMTGVWLWLSHRGEPPNERRRAILPLMILFAGIVLDSLNYLLDVLNVSVFFKLGYVVFSIAELVRFFRTLRSETEKLRRYAELENELAQTRISVMLSQIKPHFLFNALNSISALCLTDPLMADQAITSLANYLRGNIRSLEQKAPVPFPQELDHIKYYVRLEQLRYGDKLRVIYAVDCEDFTVPTLSLQTLVENAIRHGVSPKPEGGTVLVRTSREESGDVLITIVDDGVGFDPNLSGKSADSIGLANAKERFEKMLHAVFTVHSELGRGTEITIRIPAKEAHHEGSVC